MRVPLAPSWLAAALRTVLLFIALVGVASAMYLGNGPPTLARRVQQDEIARFAPTLGHGFVQLVGETGLVVLGAWIARRGLKVRL